MYSMPLKEAKQQEKHLQGPEEPRQNTRQKIQSLKDFKKLKKLSIMEWWRVPILFWVFAIDLGTPSRWHEYSNYQLLVYFSSHFN